MKSVLTLFCLLVLSLAGTVPGQTATSPTLNVRVGFVDTEIVIGESIAVRRIMGQLDRDLADQEDAIATKKREARRMRLALDQQSAVLSEKERLTRQQEIIDMLAEVDEAEFRFNQQFKEAQRGAVEPLLAEVIRTVGEVARRDKFDLVLRGEMVLYGNEAVDLTPLVIRELDSQEERLRKLVLPEVKPNPDDEKKELFNALPLVP